MKNTFLVFILIISKYAMAQVFVPFAYWNAKATRPYRLECLGCYPTPATQFYTAGKYYVTTNTTVTLLATFSTGDLCFGPTTAGGCASGPTYPLLCTDATNPGGISMARQIQTVLITLRQQ